LFKVKSRGQ